MINEVARRIKEAGEARELLQELPKVPQDPTAAIMAQLVQLLSPITARLDAMERRELSPAPQTHTPETQPDTTTYLERSQKKRLPNLERFDGDRSNYPGWKYECEGKLEYDSHLYPSQDAKKRYILSRTKEKAT